MRPLPATAAAGALALLLGAGPDTGPARIPYAPGAVADRVAGHLDLRGTVVGRRTDWLELLACSPGTREHEAIVTLDASAAEIQVGLLLLGLEPGTPATTQWVDGEPVHHPPTGPVVGVSFVLDTAPDTPVPANLWVIDQETGATLPDARWLFTGSRWAGSGDQQRFLADVNGTLLSLVNFGDDLLARSTGETDDGATGLWTANTPAIPPVGTRLTLRITPEPPAPPIDTSPGRGDTD